MKPNKSEIKQAVDKTLAQALNDLKIDAKGKVMKAVSKLAKVLRKKLKADSKKKIKSKKEEK